MIDLSLLKDILLAKCSPVMLVEIITANIAATVDLLTHHHFIPSNLKSFQSVFTGDLFKFGLSECVGICKHFHIGQYKHGPSRMVDIPGKISVYQVYGKRQMYAFNDILQIIEPPTLMKKGCTINRLVQNIQPSCDCYSHFQKEYLSNKDKFQLLTFSVT